ncbi:MAG: response regulator transcription factor [Nitrospira sp.]|nr:response regulator transcription factor [Nitrospira sp.]
MEASNGNEGIRLFHEAPTDVVITDMYMPYPDGLEVIRKLRAHFPALKILAVSGTDGPGGMLTAPKAMGADEILPKPLGVEELLTAVSNLCGRAPSRASSPNGNELLTSCRDNPRVMNDYWKRYRMGELI